MKDNKVNDLTLCTVAIPHVGPQQWLFNPTHTHTGAVPQSESGLQPDPGGRRG